MGVDDEVGDGCVEHVWSMTELHLSTERGAESTKRCVRCGALTYVPDRIREGRGKLPPPRV
ncbi:hypothetical protein [Nocardioides sp. AX2bis]|uniref:hypothetical protein n=1 Tax=Nocardioides sp. AX2bis TaxID=2653157 RepID=UPI00135AF770|nr:hypothetical protein [Nocardioides sp. AX2bis]